MTPSEIEHLATVKAVECEREAASIFSDKMHISSDQANRLVNVLVRAAMYRCSAAMVPK